MDRTASGLPPDERGQALDVSALPPWPCCGRKGEHRFWCVHAWQNAAFEDQLCECGHRSTVHFRDTGACLYETDTDVWACPCGQFMAYKP